jgi:molecular chaperone GrpE
MTEERKTSKEIEVEFPEEDITSDNDDGDQEQISSEPTENLTNKSSKSKKEVDKKPENFKHKHEELNEQFLRLRAEFANYKKRMEREQLDLADYVKLEIIKNLLPILDDFDHMIQKSDDESNKQSVLDGAKIIYEKFRELLSGLGIEKIDAINTEFNPQYHEAVMMQEVDDKKKSGKVIDVFQEGYILNNRLIRASKVVVGKHNDDQL